MYFWGIGNSIRKGTGVGISAKVKMRRRMEEIVKVSIDTLCFRRAERMEDSKDIGRKGNGGGEVIQTSTLFESHLVRHQNGSEKSDRN